MRISIAIDGPASAGKSSIASCLAKKFNFDYINTGLMYRLVTYVALKECIGIENVDKLIEIIDNSDICICGDSVRYGKLILKDELRSQKIDSNVSYFSENFKVREVIGKKLKDMISGKNIIMDGRDIGTEILKDANLKFFITASVEIRAKRRYEQLFEKGHKEELDKILNKIEKRDEIDYNRLINPLKQADDAKIVDTSYLTFEESVDVIAKDIVEYMIPKIKFNRVVLAENRGFCHGVLRAVNTLENVVNSEKTKSIKTLGEIIHNKEVIRYFKSRNVEIVDQENIDDLVSGKDVLVIRAHGVPRDVEIILKNNSIEYLDATCGKVKLIHKKVKDYYEQGYDIVIVGNKYHPEVIGANSYCDYNAKFFLNGELDGEVSSNKVCIVCQTTEKYENFEKAVTLLKDKYNENVPLNTICDATFLRQRDVSELSKNVDIMIIVGDSKSSNSNKLYEVAKEYCDKSFIIERARDLDKNILDDIVINDYKVGVTSGASTPDWIMKEVILMIENANQSKEPCVEFKIGKVLKGRIENIEDNQIIIKLGEDVTAIIPNTEVSEDEKTNFSSFFKIGSEIDGKIISLNNSEGHIVLSRMEIYREKSLEDLKGIFEADGRLVVIVKEDVKGGVIAEYNGIKLFIPASHLDFVHIEDLSQFVGRELEIKVIEMKEEKGQYKIVGSRRAVLEEEKKIHEDKIWKSLVLGDIVQGEVKRINTFGAFVDINGVDGLLHISEISWGRIEKVSDCINIGDMITVKIIGIDPENHKLSLSIKVLQPDPWSDIEEKYPVGAIVLGKVVRFAEFGVFVELEPSVDALVHISQISHKRVSDVREFLEIGQQIKAKIVEINKENKRIELSIKVIE